MNIRPAISFVNALSDRREFIAATIETLKQLFSEADAMGQRTAVELLNNCYRGYVSSVPSSALFQSSSTARPKIIWFRDVALAFMQNTNDDTNLTMLNNIIGSIQNHIDHYARKNGYQSSRDVKSAPSNAQPMNLGPCKSVAPKK